jgi:hypothetical protein
MEGEMGDVNTMANEGTLKIIVPVKPNLALQQTEVPVDRAGGLAHGQAELISLNLSGYKAIPDDSFLDKLMTPITKAMNAVEHTFSDFSMEEITISLAVTAEGDIGIASVGVESSIEVTFKRRETIAKIVTK